MLTYIIFLLRRFYGEHCVLIHNVSLDFRMISSVSLRVATNDYFQLLSITNYKSQGIDLEFILICQKLI